MSDRPKRQRLNTVGEVIATYLERTKETYTGDAAATCRQILADFAKVKGDLSMDDVIGDDLEEYIESKKGWKSGHTRRRGASTIKKAFSWAMKKGFIRAHPFAGISYRMGGRRPAMTEEQFRAMVRASDATFRRVLYWLWWTGSRPIEMRQLRWSMINVEIGAAVLHEHKTAHSRADREPRIIYLSDKVLRLLTWILCNERQAKSHIFLNLFGRPWTPDAIEKRLRRTRKAAGVPVGVSLYSCRHAFGTRMALAGTELKALATLMGHTNTVQTNHYIHMAGNADFLRGVLEKGLAHKRESGK